MHTSIAPEKFVVPIGPQHPALKEPGHFEFTVDGEIVTGASVRLGYVHRGIEKATETRNWVQNLYLLERICGICSHTHATAYVLGVERLAGLTAPPRAQAIRELVLELERIHSHLLWLGVGAHEAGFETLFMFSWRDRETVMDLLEGLSGNRVNYSANILGGVKFDVDSAQADAIRRGLDFLEERTRHYLDVVTTDEAFLRRTRGIGVMAKEQAEDLGVVGPTARASDVERDIRVDSPYAAYAEFPIGIVVESAGDLQARFVVRVKELFECYRVIRQILDNMPPGDLETRMPRKIQENETISRVEAPRGELFYFMKSNGSELPERIKVRTPSLCNFTSVTTLAVGHQLADVPMILVGIDPCFSCNDRVVAIHRLRGERQLWTWEQLRQYGIEHYRTRVQEAGSRRQGAGGREQEAGNGIRA
ncbi:MAG TPA: nickel-dependent hydrogenase large subunit [Anaerolineae bacterium]|nr:nickel-dependent hydrogenase large subunit [Anaerolineae bacterium]